MSPQEQQDNEGTGVESEVSTEAFESDPVLTQYQSKEEQAFWTQEIEAARKERKNFNEEGIRIIKRYASEQDTQPNGQMSGAATYNIFFANTEIKKAAVYARTPKPDIKSRFDDPDDQVSRVASLILERDITYELECDGFDGTFNDIAFDRLVPGIGIGWLRLEQETTEPTHDPVVTDPMTGMQSGGDMVPGSDIG